MELEGSKENSHCGARGAIRLSARTRITRSFAAAVKDGRWRKTLLSSSLLIALASLSLAADDAVKAETKEPIFRKPFTLKLHIDKEHYLEEEIPKVPYVHDGDVYLFKDDAFGVTLTIKENSVSKIQYQPDLKKADLAFKFTQDVKEDGDSMMMLVIENRTKRTLQMKALMVVPGIEGPRETSILPIQPGLKGFEAWPHPIFQLVLRNIQIQPPAADAKGEQKKP